MGKGRSKLWGHCQAGYSVGNWSLIPLGNSRSQWGTHVAESAHLGAKGAGLFIHKLFWVIDPGCLGLTWYVNASLFPHQAGNRAGGYWSGKEIGAAVYALKASTEQQDLNWWHSDLITHVPPTTAQDVAKSWERSRAPGESGISCRVVSGQLEDTNHSMLPCWIRTTFV